MDFVLHGAGGAGAKGFFWFLGVVTQNGFELKWVKGVLLNWHRTSDLWPPPSVLRPLSLCVSACLACPVNPYLSLG